MIDSLRAAGEARQSGPVAADQSLFLFAAPAFDPPFGGDSVLYPVKMLMEDKCYRPTTGGIAVEQACFVFRQPLFKAATRNSNVIGPIGTL